jgi:hypothetical protein
MSQTKTVVQKLVVPAKIHFRSIRVIEAQLNSSTEYQDAPAKPDHYSFSIAKSIAHLPGKNFVRYRLHFLIEAREKEGAPIGLNARFTIEFHFEIENFPDNIIDKDGRLQVNEALMATLLGMAYSTARGIVLEKTQNTYLGGIILPCIDPYAVLHDQDDDRGKES